MVVEVAVPLLGMMVGNCSSSLEPGAHSTVSIYRQVSNTISRGSSVNLLVSYFTSLNFLMFDCGQPPEFML